MIAKFDFVKMSRLAMVEKALSVAQAPSSYQHSRPEVALVVLGLETQ